MGRKDCANGAHRNNQGLKAVICILRHGLSREKCGVQRVLMQVLGRVCVAVDDAREFMSPKKEGTVSVTVIVVAAITVLEYIYNLP